MSQAEAAQRSPLIRFGDFLRQDVVGGVLLLIALVLALVLANSPAEGFYFGLRDAEVGIHAVPGLTHTVGEWAADGLLAIFFFLTGLELKASFVDGELRNPAKAAVPIVAAFGGAVINLTAGTDPETIKGWAIPTATDIAFAVSVLAVVGSALPLAMRTFLLTLAVVDDLIAIVIIAIFYSQGFSFLPLLGSFAVLAVYWVLTHRFANFFMARAWAAWLILLPLGFVVWILMYNSGIHATIAGVLLGFATPVLKTHPHVIDDEDPAQGLAPVLEHRFRPLANGFAVPVFAFFSAGVAIGGLEGIRSAATDTVAIGIVLGLVFGKTIGVFSSAWLMDRFTPASKDRDYQWIDMAGLAMVAGIGFTVSLLVAELSFGVGSPHNDHAKVGILFGSTIAAVLGGGLLVWRNRHYKRLRAEGAEVDTMG